MKKIIFFAIITSILFSCTKPNRESLIRKELKTYISDSLKHNLEEINSVTLKDSISYKKYKESAYKIYEMDSKAHSEYFEKVKQLRDSFVHYYNNYIGTIDNYSTNDISSIILNYNKIDKAEYRYFAYKEKLKEILENKDSTLENMYILEYEIKATINENGTNQQRIYNAIVSQDEKIKIIDRPMNGNDYPDELFLLLVTLDKFLDLMNEQRAWENNRLELLGIK